MQSAVDFPTNTRVHIALESADVERSIGFYRTLFGQEPSKVKPGYAKFEPADPPVNLSLNHSPGAASRPAGAVAHFGVQVKSSEAVAAMTQRFRDAGLETGIEEQTACCYALQDKVWVRDPDGHAWEIFVVLDNSLESHGKEAGDGGMCCTPEPQLVNLG